LILRDDVFDVLRNAMPRVKYKLSLAV